MQNALDLNPILAAALQAVQKAEYAPGSYARWLGAARMRHADEDPLNPYGCADAANILYTLGEFPRDLTARVEAVAILQNLQDPKTGLFHEVTHHPYHVTAHCIAALELFDARPLHQLTALHYLLEPGALETFLEELEWAAEPWGASHKGAGAFAALAITGEGDVEWRKRYFQWLAQECDPDTGFWRRGYVSGEPSPEGKPIFHHLAGTFHYLFNHEWAHQPLPHPEALIDSCLRIWHEKHRPSLALITGFAEIDWVYCLTRALRQCGHRFPEVKAALREMATQYVGALTDLVNGSDTPFEDLHQLFGTLCALAELQSALPGELSSANPLKLVLDRRPFI